ncbi:MAG TPA: Co2+/Mg2+ efflux protein ApaG [Phycisphaerae bacterium]|nr:Co2+/Mg2+ efflux protein ApaG [Phycisphaerae bacterium]
MPTPALSDTTTDGIRVGATAFYIPEESSPDEDRYVFGYRIVIVNEGLHPATLRSRHWVIIDAEGQAKEVSGDGVVGQQPRLSPGQAFKYTSYCPLGTSWGTMEGTYHFTRDTGDEFDVVIGRFYLATGKKR